MTNRLCPRSAVLVDAVVHPVLADRVEVVDRVAQADLVVRDFRTVREALVPPLHRLQEEVRARAADLEVLEVPGAVVDLVRRPVP